MASLKERYEAYWSYGMPRVVAPCEKALERFLSYDWPGKRLLDLGCGTGRCSVKLRGLGWDVTSVDIAKNAPDGPLPRFVVADMLLPPFRYKQFDVVFCTDVLEHLPYPRSALLEILLIGRSAYLEWADFADSTGPATVGEHVHETVQPNEWWVDNVRLVAELESLDMRLIDSGARGHLSGGYAVVM